MSYPVLFTTPGVKSFAEAVDAERQAQLAKWGEQRYRDGTGPDVTVLAGWTAGELADAARNSCQHEASMGITSWLGILAEEVAEAFAEADPERLLAELVQIAAVCAAWIADLNSRPDPS